MKINENDKKMTAIAPRIPKVVEWSRENSPESMAETVRAKKFKLKSEIKYPPINYEDFNKKLLKKKNQKYITFLGGEHSVKGYDIALKISKKMPEEKYLLKNLIITDLNLSFINY